TRQQVQHLRRLVDQAGIKRALANQSKTIRLPVHLVDKLARMRRVAMQLTEEFGREPTDEELSDELQLPLKKISQLRRVSMRPTSLNTLVGEDDSTELADLVPDESTVSPADFLSDQALRQSLSKILHVLDDRERTISACVSRSRMKPANSPWRKWASNSKSPANASGRFKTPLYGN
ncbi:MAG: hypothetical protein HC904_05975, partial [Blastochloris sp.]|nr:hypothetical protein [Blastochloris sp.]